MKILLFGVLADVAGKSKIDIDGTDVDSLKENLFARFPELKKYTFQFAVNQELIHNNVLLNATDEIALLPPYAGG
jgi:molybdopterin synthase sulfur carrier subunit